VAMQGCLVIEIGVWQEVEVWPVEVLV
jgi:hypothetical protein